MKKHTIVKELISNVIYKIIYYNFLFIDLNLQTKHNYYAIKQNNTNPMTSLQIVRRK